jgi:hypothetical protein
MKWVRAILGLLILGLIAHYSHADTKISALPNGSALTGTELLPIVQGGSTVATTPAGILTYVNANSRAFSGDCTTPGGSGVLTCTKINGTTPGGTCTNQAVTALSSSAVPTCTTVTSAYVDTSIAKTGTDVNTSNQVTATHLASALPVAQGGTGAATLTGLVQGNGTAAFTTITNSSTVGQALRVTGAAAYGFGAIDLSNANAVTNLLPAGNVGPAGATTQIQYNNAGVLAGSPKLTWTDSTSTLALGNGANATVQTPNATSGTAAAITLAGGNGAVTNGAGGNVTERGGTGSGTGQGGSFSQSAGNGGATGSGGQISQLTGSAGASGNGTGGPWTVTLGGGNGTGAGGDGALSAGQGGATGRGGNFSISAGSSTVGLGGLFNMPGAPALASGTASDTTLFASQGVDAVHSGNVIVSDFNGDNTFVVDPFGNILCTCATAVGATDQFLYLGTSAGAPTGVPAHTAGVYANSVPVRFDTTNFKLMVYSGGWKNVADKPTSPILTGTTASIGGGALVGGTCASGTVGITGAATSMVAASDPNTYPGDGATWSAQVTSSNTVTVRVCATVALTPTASTYNVRVIP